MKNYADALGIPSKRCKFLAASEGNIKAQAEQYMTNFELNEDGTGFYHSSYVALVDRNKMIRGFYDLLKPKEVKLLKKDIENPFVGPIDDLSNACVLFETKNHSYYDEKDQEIMASMVIFYYDDEGMEEKIQNYKPMSQ